MPHLPSYKALRAFEAMIRCGTIQKAAEDLFVSPGAISQQIRKLEKELGRSLFERKGRTLAPTAQALLYASSLAQAFDIIEAATKSFTARKTANPLRIAALPSIVSQLIVPNLGSFKSCAPHIQLSFTYLHRMDDFSLTDSDILICVTDGEYRGVGSAKNLFDGSVKPVASSAYVKRYGPFEDAHSLVKAKLLHDYDTSGWRQWLVNQGISSEYTIDGDVYEDFGLLIHATLSGHGVALCPPDLIRRELQNGELVVVSQHPILIGRKYTIILPNHPLDEAKIFCEWLLEITTHHR